MDAPEQGERGEAREYLTLVVVEKSIYLDIDEMNWSDVYGRVVSMVDVGFNTTHLIDVNVGLIAQHFGTVWDHRNKFDPSFGPFSHPRLLRTTNHGLS